MRDCFFETTSQSSPVHLCAPFAIQHGFIAVLKSPEYRSMATTKQAICGGEDQRK